MAVALGVIGDIVKTTAAGFDFLKSITGAGPGPDFYKIRLEIGNNQDASGNPPSIILTDFSNTTIFGVFEGTSTKPSDQCRNNKDLPKGDLDDVDLKLFNGLKNGEAPVNAFKTENGFNLKTVDFQGGGNAICISNMIFKGSDTQARRDEIFFPIGDLAFLCGKEWNWGTILGDKRQRCVWLDGQPDDGNKPMQSISLDMEKIAGIFNIDKEKKLENLDLKTACSLFRDNTGEIPNRNDCKTSLKRNIASKNVMIDTVPLVNISSAEFSDTKNSNNKNFIGAGFVTADNKFFDGQTKAFKDVSPVQDPGAANPASKPASKPAAKAPEKLNNRDLSSRSRERKRRARESRKTAARTRRQKGKKEEKEEKDNKNRPQKRETVTTLIKVHTCQATVDGVAPQCSIDGTVAL